VVDTSSVCTSSACGAIARIAFIASTIARHCVSSARTIVRSSFACGYHKPYSPLKRAVVSGSLTTV
jgi:hypothetical protein